MKYKASIPFKEFTLLFEETRHEIEKNSAQICT